MSDLMILADQFGERFVSALEKIGEGLNKTPTPKEHILNVDTPPKTPDGTNYRYKLMHGGYLLERYYRGEATLFYEDSEGNRVQLIAKPPE